MDFAVVMVFVGVGRTSHGHGLRFSGVASTAWPFACGLALGWLVILARRRRGTSFVDGLQIASATVIVGMVLRVVVGQGTALAFVLVATGFLGAAMGGLRLLRLGIQRGWAFRRP